MENTVLRHAVDQYDMPTKARELLVTSKLLILCGVTAAGKNTISNYLIDHDNFAYIISHTTRKPRSNHGVVEANGQHYWFVNNEAMLKLVQQQIFVEVKAVHGDTFYGTSIMAIEQALKSGKIPLTEIDIQGALELMRQVSGLRPLFVLPPTFSVWMDRLNSRGAMATDEKNKRLQSAIQELDLAIANAQFLFIINHEVEETVIEIMHGIDDSIATQLSRRLVAKQLLEQLKNLF